MLYFRHAATNFGRNDDRLTGFENCVQQRNLTDRGRDEARTIGAAINRLHIPIGAVLASPFWRTRETAQLIFGRVTVAAGVRGGPAQPDDRGRYGALHALLSKPVPAGGNTAIR